MSRRLTLAFLMAIAWSAPAQADTCVFIPRAEFNKSTLGIKSGDDRQALMDGLKQLAGPETSWSGKMFLLDLDGKELKDQMLNAGLDYAIKENLPIGANLGIGLDRLNGSFAKQAAIAAAKLIDLKNRAVCLDRSTAQEDESFVRDLPRLNVRWLRESDRMNQERKAEERGKPKKWHSFDAPNVFETLTDMHGDLLDAVNENIPTVPLSKADTVVLNEKQIIHGSKGKVDYFVAEYRLDLSEFLSLARGRKKLKDLEAKRKVSPQAVTAFSKALIAEKKAQSFSREVTLGSEVGIQREGMWVPLMRAKVVKQKDRLKKKEPYYLFSVTVPKTEAFVERPAAVPPIQAVVAPVIPSVEKNTPVIPVAPPSFALPVSPAVVVHDSVAVSAVDEKVLPSLQESVEGSDFFSLDSLPEDVLPSF